MREIPVRRGRSVAELHL